MLLDLRMPGLDGMGVLEQLRKRGNNIPVVMVTAHGTIPDVVEAMRLGAIDDSTLELRIEDNGVGFDPRAVRPGHYGLVGLREQAEIIDAHLDILSVPNEGTTLRVVLHLPPVVFEPMSSPTR